MWQNSIFFLTGGVTTAAPPVLSNVGEKEITRSSPVQNI